LEYVARREELQQIPDKYGGSSEVGHAATGVKADGALHRHFSVTGESQLKRERTHKVA